MPVGVSSQQNRIWNTEWNEATVQNGVPRYAKMMK